ncbi:transglutaminase-like domain-containing protein [Anaeromyxobacter sp. Fw109-5]|uniref:transglutaminase-like domain-containing protein n=1 Tax=Anaeromyxobacter sp. (strain Fw109-5) TaxID=404589 RepID=UPI0000ED79AF|nr:transglutaminase-like domain-containing protein [Anaeromyxobacter sp. Fw109-5]ABS24563.1 transglutaminase domain protein [Anaeromyxobacter sp. Fw109-5]
MRSHRLATGVLAALALSVTACPEQRGGQAKPPRPPRGELAAGAAALPDALSVPRPPGPEWFGLYLVGKKAGFTKVQLSRELRDGRDVLVGRSETLVRATVGGKTVERRAEEERVYEARHQGPLLAVRSVWAGDGGDRTVSGTCARAVCKLVEETAAGRQERTVEGVTETAELADGVRLAAARRGAVRGRQLDLEKLRVKEMQDVFLRRETIAGGGVQEQVSVVAESEAGDRLAAEYRVADDGRIVEIRLGEAIVARPEPEDVARSLEQVDLFALARVAVPRPLPRTVPTTITFRLAGLPPSFQKGDARQRFARGRSGETVLSVTARRPLAADPARDTPLALARKGASADDLAATPQADADSAAIAALAKKIAGDAPGAYAAAQLLADDVYRRLEKAYGASHDRASEVLAAGRGDCTEHTVLLVALARALGIPARPVHGLVYARYEDGQDALYWHAWAEVRSAGEWIAMDPTFGQPVADATHVALGVGTQVDTVGLLGALKVLGVEVKAGR